MRILMILFCIICIQIPGFAQNKSTLTNDDFPKSSIASKEQSSSVNATNNSTSETPNSSLSRTSDLKLQYELSELQLAAAEYPDNQSLKDRIAEVRKKMNATSVMVSKQDWTNIYWRNQLVLHKISIIKLEKQIKLHQDRIAGVASADPYNPDLHAAVVYIEKEKEQLRKMYEDYEKVLENARKDGASSKVIP